MFLKRIELKGFKSFAQKTIVDFDEGLTIIVGPNGSGKSNINDAIKWVLGETSRKNLRASSSSDIIFNGTETEKSSDLAEVVLLFNNEKKLLNLNFNEVSITRRTYRSEDVSDEYFINKSKVRRRDIRDLFIDTGLGNTDLSIISQSSVSKISESKPEELRNLLNEAAGVAKYELQKNEAIRKLEKVNKNLEIFEVKLAELKKHIGPLKKQADKSKIYLEYKDKLRKIELPLIKQNLEKNVSLKKDLEKKINDLNIIKETSKENIDSFNEKISQTQKKLVSLENEIGDLQKKQIELSSTNRSNHTSEDDLSKTISSTINSLNEIKVLEIENEENLDSSREEIVLLREDRNKLSSRKEKIKYDLNSLEFELSRSNTKKLGRGTEIILQNKNIFNGIYGTLSSLISIKKEYELALNISLGKILENIIVDNENTIKEAISFLKKHKYGTATFIPAEQVEPKIIPDELNNIIENIEGYIGTLSSLIKTKKDFNNVIWSIGGRILVFDNIDNAISASKKLNYKFKIVTLEGDLIFPGFIVRGGHNSKENLSISLDESKKNQNLLKENLLKIENEFSQIDLKIDDLQSKITLLNTNQARFSERKLYLETTLSKLLTTYEKETGKKFDVKIDSIEIPKIKGLSLEKVNSLIKEKQDERREFVSKQQQYQEKEKQIRDEWMNSTDQLTESKIKLDRTNTLINNELNILNRDYKMTFEVLLNEEIKELKVINDKVKDERVSLRKKISDLGFVNLDALEEYEELKKDYDEFNFNTSDLNETKNKLLSTISKTDEIMKKQFTENLVKVNKEFDKVFKTLFKGGKAKLSLENEDDLLNSGILIKVQAPGKAINNMSLFSGGEKSLTALSLIFSINLVRQLPLLILDEPEASLDEANVERFAKFAKSLNDHAQVIVTTHRPGTMEEADVIYGVTMQKKGITKIVSVKLEDAVELVE